jgi:hypothetical protein
LSEKFLLVRRQVVLFVFAIDGEPPELIKTRPPVINHPESAALAFASSMVAETDFSQPAHTFHQIARFRVFQQLQLKAAKQFVVQVIISVLLKGGSSINRASMFCTLPAYISITRIE